MEPNSDNGDPVEPRVNEPTTRVDENTGNDNNPEASDVSELEESHDSAWTAHSRSNTTYSSEQAETHDDEGDLKAFRTVFPYDIFLTFPILGKNSCSTLWRELG